MTQLLPVHLHVDDDFDSTVRLHNVIKGINPNIMFHNFSTGPMALGHLLTTEDKGERPPNLITMDLNIDKGTGLEFITSLRMIPAFVRIPLVVLYNGTQNQDMIQAYKLGVSGCTPKPLDTLQWSTLGNELMKMYLAQAHYQDNPELASLYNSRPVNAKAKP